MFPFHSCLRRWEKMTSVITLFVFLLISFTIISVNCNANTEVTSTKTIVFRCCNKTEKLSIPASTEDIEGKLRCIQGGNASWAPVIYSPSNGGFVTPGTVPKDWDVRLSTRPLCRGKLSYIPSHPHSSIASYVLFDNGSLWNENYPQLVEPGLYCIDPAGCLVCLGGEDGVQVPLTFQEDTVPKCCGNSAAYSEELSACVQSTRPWPLPVAHRSGFPTCSEPGGFVIAGHLGQTHSLNEFGRVTGPTGDILASQFCLETLEDRNNDYVAVFTCPSSSSHRHKWRRNDDLRFTLYPMGLFLSVFFLTVTLIASCLLPSTYHVLHWRCQTNHVACLLLGDLILAIVQLSGNALPPTACVTLAISMHFLFLAAFFWLNTMCFNIWWTFRDLRPTSLDKGQEVCRLRMYQLYAWGGPLLIAGIAAIMDTLPDDAHPGLIRPKFGEERCWFYGDAEIFSYFFGPIGILLLLNMTLFVATARELTCGLWKTEVVKSNTERATLGRVCIKLVVVMGITWVVDVISWVVGGPHYLWYLTDLINALQGVMIFAVVGCQPQVWAAVKRLWCLQESPSEGGAARSSSSHAMPSVGVEQNTTTTTKGIETLC
ncbi:putative G-protein coupled receptor Mth-like 1 [Lycorma delicatula]|uniref:putative G-protein coupled receptor Mth-like 1 n=1 Tax=Lycorma delicatula TaxID=130591 RepID=UPI003F5141E3